jgi:hypothetical protein
MKLTKEEQQLETPDQLFLKWLFEKKVSVNGILTTYSNYLEEIERQQNITIHGLVQPLSDYITEVPKQRKNWDKAKAVYHILRTKIFKGTPFEKDLEKINKQFGYGENDNGTPIKTIK